MIIFPFNAPIWIMVSYLALGSFHVFGQMGSYVSDLKVVRAILDSNGLHDKLEEEVAFIDDQSRRVIDLNLSKLTITRLPKSIGRLRALQSLDLSRNKLQTIPTEIGFLSELISLNLTRNKIQALPETIGQLSQLKTLLMSFNQLTRLPKSIGNLAQLEQLMISKNQLLSLPNSIMDLTPSLFISYNKLCALPADIEGWLNDFCKDQQWKQHQNCTALETSEVIAVNDETPTDNRISQVSPANTPSLTVLPAQTPIKSEKPIPVQREEAPVKRPEPPNEVWAPPTAPHDNQWEPEPEPESWAITQSATVSDQPDLAGRVLPDSAWDTLLEPDEGDTLTSRMSAHHFDSAKHASIPLPVLPEPDTLHLQQQEKKSQSVRDTSIQHTAVETKPMSPTSGKMPNKIEQEQKEVKTWATNEPKESRSDSTTSLSKGTETKLDSNKIPEQKNAERKAIPTRQTHTQVRKNRMAYKNFFELQEEDPFFKENVTMEMVINGNNNALYIFKQGQLAKKFDRFQTIDLSWLPSRTKKGQYYLKATIDGVTFISNLEI